MNHFPPKKSPGGSKWWFSASRLRPPLKCINFKGSCTAPWKYTLTAFLLKFLKQTPQNQGTYITTKNCKETSSSFIFFNFFTVTLEESAEKIWEIGWKLQVQHSTSWPPDRLIPSLPRPKAPLLLRQWVPDSPYEVIDLAIKNARKMNRWTRHSTQSLPYHVKYIMKTHI